jgi:23S rRNA (guanosine2251-2'-O)-methyltransferase
MSSRIYGVHSVRALLERRPDEIVRAHVLADAAAGRLAALVEALEAKRVRIERVDRRELDRMTGGAAHQGIVVETSAAAEFTLTAFEELVISRGSDARLLVLDGVEDPRNLGACLRTADAARIDAVVVPRSRAAKLTPAARKTATGAAERVPLLYAPAIAKVLRWLRSAGVRCIGADAEGSRPLFDARFAPPIALVLGGEGRGLKPATREACDELVAIPMYGGVESLNVSVAAAVMMYELLRQAPPTA